MNTDTIDGLRSSYRSMLDARNLSPDQLKDLAAALFVTCYATVTKCEESLADRDIPAAETAGHVSTLQATLDQGHVLASLDFLADLPARFKAAREAGEVAASSKSGKRAVDAKEKKLQRVRKYALDLANASAGWTKTDVLDEIVESVKANYLKVTGRPMTGRGRATISGWLKEAGFIELSKRHDTPTR